MTKIKFITCGENAIIIKLGDTLNMEINSFAVAIENYMQSQKISHIIESTPLLNSVFVRYDTAKIDAKSLIAKLKPIIEKAKTQKIKTNHLWHLPICYEGKYAPDIEDLANVMQLSPAEIKKQHANEMLQVLMLGFAPGWIYGGLLPKIWDVPRLSAAKPNVPAGSISVAVRQVIVSATVAPTGWRTIGRTPYLNFDLKRKDIFTMRAGDKIKIEKISERDFTLLQKEFASHKRSLHCEAL